MKIEVAVKSQHKKLVVPVTEESFTRLVLIYTGKSPGLNILLLKMIHLLSTHFDSNIESGPKLKQKGTVNIHIY